MWSGRVADQSACHQQGGARHAGVGMLVVANFLVRDRPNVNSHFTLQQFWLLARRDGRAYPASEFVSSEQPSQHVTEPAGMCEVFLPGPQADSSRQGARDGRRSLWPKHPAFNGRIVSHPFRRSVCRMRWPRCFCR